MATAGWYCCCVALLALSCLSLRVDNRKIPPDKEETSTSFKPDTDRCGPIRWNYRCGGSAYDEYLAAHSGTLRAIYHSAAKPKEHLSKRSILFVGNSHTREVAEAFLCQRRTRIASWAHTTENGCLVTSPFAQRCDSSEANCTDDMGRAELVDGRKVYMAINHPWIYTGTEGLHKAFALLGVNVTALDVIVAGVWNTDEWALQTFVIERSTPICGGDFDHTGVRRFDADGFSAALQELGFKGQLLLGGMFGEGPPEPPHASHDKFGFKVGSLGAFPSGCFVPGCTTVNISEDDANHQCLPGPPDFVAARVDSASGWEAE